MTDSDKLHLLAAQGWLELGLLADAFSELDNITPGNRAHPDVLVIRWNVYHEAGKWNEATVVAGHLTISAPERFEGWWMLSFALHELKRTQEAHNNLAGALWRFKGEWLAHYNLACYLVQLGRIAEARERLKYVFDLNPAMRQEALKDPDLEPLWAELQSK